MKKIALVLFSLLTVSLLQAQQKAVTETGDEVILYQDGTWKYQNENQFTEKETPTNPNSFEKDENSSFLLKSNTVNIGFWLNPKVWSFKKTAEDQDAEYELQLKGEDLYGMIISEKTQIPLEALKLIAVENAKEAAPDIEIIKQEYRTVNGIKVLLLHMNGTTQGIKFSYYGYYYSSANGTVQFLTYTSQNLLESYIPKIEKLLNGMVELN